MPTKVYKYSLLDPVQGQDKVLEQIQLAHCYQHLHTSLSRAQTRAYLDARRRLVGDLDHAERALDLAKQYLEHARSYVSKQHALRKNRRTLPEEKQKVSSLRVAVKYLGDNARKLRQKAKVSPEFEEEKQRIRERDHILRLALRAAMGPQGQGLCHGTYCPIENAAQVARKSGHEPAYRPLVRNGYVHADAPWGDGMIGAQIQGGLPCTAVMHMQHRYLRIEPLPSNQWSTRRGRKKAYTRVWLRVGSEGKRKDPVWSVFPMLMHRPLPQDGIIMRADVKREVRGTRATWSLLLTVREPEKALSKNSRTVAVHAGWRMTANGLRIAYIRDDRGQGGPLYLDPRVRVLAKKARDLQSLLDRYLNLALAYFRAWLSTDPDAPAWLKARAKNMHAWKSSFRLVRLVEHWRNNRFEGDTRIYGLLWFWRERWRHLYQWESGCMRRAIAIRRNQYLCLAASLSKEYGTVITEDTDYRYLARRSPSEKAEEELPQVARRHRQLAAVGEFRLTLENKALGEGLSAWRVSAKGLTGTCHKCGSSEKVEPDKIYHTCSKCGAVWDRDINVTENMLARERREEGKDLRRVRAPKKPNRFAQAAE